MIKKRVLLVVAIIISLAAIVDGLGCGWSRVDTVRYNQVRSLESLAILPRPVGERYFLDRHSHDFDEYGYNEDLFGEETEEANPNETKTSKEPPKELTQADKLFATAKEFEAEGKYTEALESYHQAYKMGIAMDNVAIANSILDRIDVLNSSAVQNSEALKLYLQARDLYDDDIKQKANETLDRILANNSYQELHDNTLFLKAAIKYFREDYQMAAKELNQLIKTYPKSEKLAASYFLLGKIYYRQTEANRDFYPDKKNKLAMDKAIKAFDQAIKLDANGFLTPECYGWKAGSYWLANDQLLALSSYTQAFLLDKRNPERWLKEVEFTYSFITPLQDQKAIEIVSIDPRLLISYVWYGIYHHTKVPKRQLILARGAQSYLATHPDVELANSLKIRIAQSLYNAKSYPEIISLVEGLVKDEKFGPEALWMRGVSQTKLSKFAEAEADFRRIIKEYPKSNLKRGAIEELAITLEKANKLLDATIVYLENDYLADARYMMDIILSVEQVQELLARPNLPNKDEVFYALGSKYMLDLELDKAEEAFRKIQAQASEPKSGQSHDVGTEKLRILEVISELRTLINAEKAAKTDDEKAKATYDIGAYIYHKNNKNEGRHAIFNNVMIQTYDSPYFASNYFTAPEVAKAQKRFDRANLLLRAEEYFKTVFTKYPKSPEAPKAIYSAALCRLWLVDYHQYHVYPKRYKADGTVEVDYDNKIRELDQQQADKYFDLLAKRYPDHPLNQR